jgi:CCR4-NOT transcription complex subunit 3
MRGGNHLAIAYQRISDADQMQEVLEMMSPSAPQPRDAERRVYDELYDKQEFLTVVVRPKYHAPRHPAQTPSYYPQQVPNIMSTPEFFERLDLDSLFWAFYYMPGTYQQCVFPGNISHLHGNDLIYISGGSQRKS